MPLIFRSFQFLSISLILILDILHHLSFYWPSRSEAVVHCSHCRCRRRWRSQFRFSSRTTGPISTNLSTTHLCVQEIQVCSNEGPRLFPRMDNNKIPKIQKCSSPEFLSHFQSNMAQTVQMKDPPISKGDNYKIVKNTLQ